VASQNQPTPESNFLTTGTEAAPGYRLCKRLGAGGFGEVWEAEGPGGFHVALKIVRLGDRAAAAELRSLDILKSIRHPNLLSTFGAWESHSWLVIAMELADRTLWDRFQEAVHQGLPGIPRDELHEYILEAAKGIDYLNAQKPAWEGEHSMGVQHRDIKPQNILLVGNGVKVADFGLARLLEHTITGHTGSMTVAYAPPEFFRGQTSRQSDQYSLAVTYCELRGGRLPFVGSSAQVMAGHLMHPPDLTALPEEEQPVVARALAKEPKERWPNCRSFAETLHACRPSAVFSVPVAVEGHAAVDRFATSPSSRLAEQGRSDAAPLSAVAAPGSVKKLDTATVEHGETDLQAPHFRRSTSRAARRWTRRALWASLAIVPVAAGLALWTSGMFRPSTPPSPLSNKIEALPLPPVAEAKPAATLPPPVAEAKPAFILLEPTAVAIKASCKKTIAMRFRRENQANPTAVRIEHLPAGVTASKVTIPAGSEQAEIEFSASDTAEQGNKEAEVFAVAGATEFRAHFPLTVQPSPRLQITLPDTLPLEAGRRATVLVQLERDGFEGPVKLQFEGLLKGIRPVQEPTIPADADKYRLSFAAAFSMDEMQQPIKLIAHAGRLRAEAKLQLQVKPTLTLMHLKKAAGYEDLIQTYTQAIRTSPKDAIAYYNRGYVYNLRGEYDKAIADCSEAIAIDRDFAAAYSSRGYAYNAKQESEKALADCNEAVRLDTKSAFAYKERGCAYLAKRDYEKAIADCDEAIRLAPNSALAYNNRGVAYSIKGDYDKAIADCDTAIGLDPKLPHAYNNRGNVYLKKQDYEKAIADSTKAIELDPEFALPYCHRGEAFYHKKEYDLAIADCTEAIQHDATLARAYNDRGMAYFSKREYDEAITDFTEAIRLIPKYTFPYNNRGIVFQQRNEVDKALADFTEALRLDPNYVIAYSNRGHAHIKKTNYDQAIADCTKAIQLDPSQALPHYNRGVAHHYKMRYDLALADFTEAIRLDPTLAGAYNGRGWTYYCKQDYEKAMKDFTESIRLNSKFALAYNNRGLIHQKKKDFDMAIADFTEAIRLDAKSANAYGNRASVYCYAKRDYEKAIADCNQVLRLNPKSVLAYQIRAAANSAKGDEARARADREEIRKIQQGPK
jgi:tetratricopeptide (TPR) repeat protein/serine/threonine protein kinase